MINAELVQWLEEQLVKFRGLLASRNTIADAWKSGTARSWRSVGCQLNKAQRLEEARKHARIAERCARDVRMCEQAIAEISKQTIA